MIIFTMTNSATWIADKQNLPEDCPHIEECPLPGFVIHYLQRALYHYGKNSQK
jgi:hypothetical protein